MKVTPNVLFESLKRTRQSVFGRVATLLGSSEISNDFWDELEELFIQADMGVSTADYLIQKLRKAAVSRGVILRADMFDLVRETLVNIVAFPERNNLDQNNSLNVIVLVGVNGAGKTTTLAKVAKHFSAYGWRILIAAGDTFRAAAIEQLQTWGERIGVPVIAGQSGGDAGAVVYDAIQASVARKMNLLLIDTAGRLHTKFNLMEELKKVCHVVARHVENAPHEVWLVLDATGGQNSIEQARQFKDSVGVTGVIVSKLDGSAKGGFIFAISRELNLPVRYVGVGEADTDLIEFSPNDFVNSLIPSP